MKSRAFAQFVMFVGGIVVGAVITALLAQRAAYFGTAEELARISSNLEQGAKNLAAGGKAREAEQALIATVAVRKVLAETDTAELIPPLTAPSSMLLEVLSSPNRPSLSIHEIYRDRATMFMQECALVDLPGRSVQEESKVQERKDIVARYPNSNEANCAAIGPTFWKQ